MKLLRVTQTPSNTKQFMAVFELDNGKQKIVRFGTKSNYVLNRNKSAQDRANYIKRHAVRENWRNPLSPGALSRFLLWGNSRSLKANIADFKKRFKL